MRVGTFLSSLLMVSAAFFLERLGRRVEEQDEDRLAVFRRLTGKEWIAMTPWTAGGPLWSCIQGMKSEWHVSLDSTTRSLRLIHRPFEWPYGRLHRTGPVYGWNGGEFGGDVRWVRGPADTVVLVPHNWVQYLPVDSGTYVLAGLAHMTMSTGSLWFLKAENNVWSSRKVADLGAAPNAGMIQDSVAIVSTLRSIVTVSLRDGKTTEKPFDRWLAPYANSVARGPDGWLYIGMRPGVARVRTSDTMSMAEWLVPSTLPDSLSGRCH